MTDDDTERTGPSLELPKLGRRKPRTATVEPPVAQVELEPEPRRRKRRPHRPRRPGGMVAAVVTGVLVGLGLVGLTWSSLRACEAVQGTPSCGGTGYPMLAAIIVVLVVIGWALLRVLRVPEPGSTSVLAVGLTAVLALLFLIDSLTDRAMIVVIPVLCAGSFAAAHWVTRTFVEPPRDT